MRSVPRGRALAGGDPKQVYMARGSMGDAELMECVALAYIPEKDGAAKICANYDALTGDPGTQTVIASILRDEERHVEYLGSWLQRFERRLSPRFVAATLERLQDAFDQLDAAFYGAF